MSIPGTILLILLVFTFQPCNCNLHCLIITPLVYHSMHFDSFITGPYKRTL